MSGLSECPKQGVDRYRGHITRQICHGWLSNLAHTYIHVDNVLYDCVCLFIYLVGYVETLLMDLIQKVKANTFCLCVSSSLYYNNIPTNLTQEPLRKIEFIYVSHSLSLSFHTHATQTNENLFMNYCHPNSYDDGAYVQIIYR